MYVASLEPCAKLYELSGWCDSGYCWAEAAKGWKLEHCNPFDNYGMTKQWGCVTAYDLGYLLRRLPAGTYVRKNIQEPQKSGGNYKGKFTASVNSRATLKNYNEYADTPEDATAKLCIELFKQGILTKETP